MRNGLFARVAENSKKSVTMVDTKGGSYDLIVKVRKHRMKPEFMAKGWKKFVRERELARGDVLIFSEGVSPDHISVEVQKRDKKIPPVATVLGLRSSIGSVHTPIEPPAAAPPVALGLGSSIVSDYPPLEPPTAAQPVALGTLEPPTIASPVAVGFDHTPLEPPAAAPPVALGLGLSIGSDHTPHEPPQAAPPVALWPLEPPTVAPPVAVGLGLSMGFDHMPLEPPAAAPPVALELGFSVGSDHTPLQPPATAPPVAPGLSLSISSSDHAPMGLGLGLSLPGFSLGDSLGGINGEVQKKGLSLQLTLGPTPPPAFTQHQTKAELALALSLSLASNVMAPPTPVQGPPTDLNFSATAGTLELLKSELKLKLPATALSLAPPEAACLLAAPSAGISFLAKAGSHELLAPKPPTVLSLAPPAACSAGFYSSASGSHELLEPKPKPRATLALGGAPLSCLAEEHARGLYSSGGRFDELQVATLPQAVVNPPAACGAGLISFSPPFGDDESTHTWPCARTNTPSSTFGSNAGA